MCVYSLRRARVVQGGEKRCEHRKNVVNTVDVFFSVQTCRWTSAKSRGCTAAGLPSLEYTHQPWSSLREEGLRYKWDEPRDPAASLADQTLRRRAAQTAHTGSAALTTSHRPPTMAGITGIGGEKFSGKPGDWPETKTEIIA